MHFHKWPIKGTDHQGSEQELGISVFSGSASGWGSSFFPQLLLLLRTSIIITQYIQGSPDRELRISSGRDLNDSYSLPLYLKTGN